jgi:hypothetical protein
MTRRRFQSLRRLLSVALGTFVVAALLIATAIAQVNSTPSDSYERTYRQSKAVVERALKQLQPSLGGHLPVLEGFALPSDRPLSRYQRAYYQSAVQVSSTASGGSVVRVNSKVTAWYADPAASRSGYQLLTSNGRLESDLLDQLTDLLATNSAATSSGARSNVSSGAGSDVGSNERSSETFPAVAPPAPTEWPTSAGKGTANNGNGDSMSAPMPKSSENAGAFTPSDRGLSAQQLADSKNSQKPLREPATGLQAEAASLEEVLKNQAHPKNLVAIKKTGTPVVASPSLSGKTLFLASAHDEFEMLDYNADWVHVRVSGLSRAWIWRTSLEMPEGISDIPKNVPNAAPVAADLFQVTREETAPFPGDWEPLRGKNVKIISVQKIQENEKDSGAQAKLEFAKSLLDKNYADLAAKSQELYGIVLIFDSIDGGMIAATLPTVQQWEAGTLTDAALWHQCYFDPPETFNTSSASGSH